MTKKLRIGTRGSPLALAQAKDVRARLVDANDSLQTDDIEIIVIKTSGDRILDQHLMTAGGKGLFTKEIEEALLSGDIDCAVHSSKDMPTALPEGLKLAVFLPREDPRDAFISERCSNFMDLPQGAILGTASLRRRAQALRLRPDLKVITFRGNVQSRLRKISEGEADATFLAVAGLNRLKLPHVAMENLSLAAFLPAPAQGAVTVEVRTNDAKMAAFLEPLHHAETALAVMAERAFLARLDGSCRTPVAAYATLQDNVLSMRAILLSIDGQQVYEASDSTGANIEDAVALGLALGDKIKQDAGPEFFEILAKAVEAEFE